MAKTTYVKAAQQRYEMVPVIDPETGKQKQTPVMRNGKQRVTKTGRPIFMSVTVADKTKPLPNYKCGKCGCEIKVGDPYKHITPKSGPYGGRTMRRCASCPQWQVWEYSSSLSARVAEISHDFWNEVDNASDADEVQECLNSAAERVREIAEEKREGASNIEDGFGHSTYQSDELNDVADQLDSWADDIESADIPDYPEAEEHDCDDCEGSGEVDNDQYELLHDKQEETQVALEAFRRRLTLLNAIQVPLSPQAAAERKKLLEVTIPALVKELEAVEALLLETEAQVSCETCDGTGRVEDDEPTVEQVDEWKEEVQGNLSIVDECPV